MMTIDEVNTLLAGLGGDYKHPYSGPERAVIATVYYEVLGRHLPDNNCPDKWRDAVVEINIYIKKHGKMKEKTKYRLRQGVILQIAGSSQVYTNDNLTDKIAEKYLKENPNAAKRFEIIPTDEKDTAAAGSNDAERLRAADIKIAELEAVNKTQESLIAAELEDTTGSGSDDSKGGVVASEVVKQAIAAELAAGKSKTVVKSEFTGKEIDGVKLTHRLVGTYIKIITQEKE